MSLSKSFMSQHIAFLEEILQITLQNQSCYTMHMQALLVYSQIYNDSLCNSLNLIKPLCTLTGVENVEIIDFYAMMMLDLLNQSKLKDPEPAVVAILAASTSVKTSDCLSAHLIRYIIKCPNIVIRVIFSLREKIDGSKVDQDKQDVFTSGSSYLSHFLNGQSKHVVCQSFMVLLKQALPGSDYQKHSKELEMSIVQSLLRNEEEAYLILLLQSLKPSEESLKSIRLAKEASSDSIRIAHLTPHIQKILLAHEAK